MKKLLFALLALSLSSMAFAGNYILTIDGVAYEVELDKQKKLQTKKGIISVGLSKKAIATYAVDGVSFDHPSELTPSMTQLSEGVKQIMMIEGSGNLFLLQIYDDIDASLLVPILEKELTKEEVVAGYKKTGKPMSFKLNSGKILKGREVKTTNGSDEYDRYIVGCSTKTGGIVAVIQLNDLELEGQDKNLMTNALKSLKANCVDD